jgi:hypothetical protein
MFLALLSRGFSPTLEVESRSTAVQGQLGKNISKTPSQLIILGWWCASVILAMWKAIGMRIIASGLHQAKTLPEK